jgi:hypothetical protein
MYGLSLPGPPLMLDFTGSIYLTIQDLVKLVIRLGVSTLRLRESGKVSGSFSFGFPFSYRPLIY